jgi:hypothetical protein
VNLPNADKVRIERTKIVDYLLAGDHPEGAGKAAFFAEFGFTTDAWESLAEALLAHACTYPVASIFETQYGTNYRVEGPLICPDGRSPFIRAAWVVDKDADTPGLVTAHPIW